METGVEVTKVDAQGRFILQLDWREAEIGESRELYVIKRRGYLKLVPKHRVDLTECFDKVDLGVDAIENWSVFNSKNSLTDQKLGNFSTSSWVFDSSFVTFLAVLHINNVKVPRR